MISSVAWVCLGMLGVGMFLLLVRAVQGPTVLDRVVALDVILAFVIVGLCLDAAVRGVTETLVVLLVLNLFGFVGSVAVARFVAPDPVVRRPDDGGTGADDGRIRGL